MTDLIILFKKLSGKRAKLQDCYKLNQAVDSLPALIYSLRKLNNTCVTAVFLDSLSEVYANMEKYQDMIESMLDLSLIDRGEFMLKSTVNSEIKGNPLYDFFLNLI